MQIGPNMNGKNVTYKSRLHFDDNDELTWCLNEKVCTSFDNVFGMKFEHQRVVFIGIYVTIQVKKN